MIEDELPVLKMQELRSLKFKIERRIHDLEVHYLKLGIAAKLKDSSTMDVTVTACPYAIGTEEALLWQEGYDKY